jgi:hypothetical protein
VEDVPGVQGQREVQPVRRRVPGLRRQRPDRATRPETQAEAGEEEVRPWWPTAVELDAEEALYAEFPGWKVTTLSTLGRWEAFWRSGDGKHRHIIIASTAAELLGLLREIRGEA